MTQNLGNLFIDAEGVIEDENGNHTLTNSGVTLNTTDKHNGSSSLDFNGSSIITAPFHLDFQPESGEFTVDFWVRPTSLANPIVLIGSGGVGGSADVYGWSICYYNRIYGYTKGASGTTLHDTAATFTVGAWHHVAMILNGTSIKLYLNGTQIHSSNTSNATSSGDKKLVIGATHEENQRYFSGQIDQVRITKGESLWTDAFSTDDISLLYTTPITYTEDQCEGGTATASTTVDGSAAGAFDNIVNGTTPANYWHSDAGPNEWLAYEFTEPKQIEKFTLIMHNPTTSNLKDFSFEGWTGTEWEVVHTGEAPNIGNALFSIEFTNNNSYIKYRLRSAGTNWVGNDYFVVYEMEMMERAVEGTPYVRPDNISGLFNLSNLKGNLRGKAAEGFIRPTIKQFFTSSDFGNVLKPINYSIDKCEGGTSIEYNHYNNQDSSKAFANTTGDAVNYAYQAVRIAAISFIGYDFGTEMTIEKYTITFSQSPITMSLKGWDFQGWTGSSWITLHSIADEAIWAAGEKRAYTFTNQTGYTKYRFFNIINHTSGFFAIDEIEMMERLVE